jgi:ABC-type Fe3+/spermidine/putrescine transport system ATPase subunit
MPEIEVIDIATGASSPGPTAALSPPIRVRDLAKRFGPQVVLAGVSFDLHEGELLVVLGPSGSGKTTLLRLLAGLETAEAGEIELLGREATSLPPQRRGFGIVFQEQALFTRMTVEQNVAFGLELRGVAAEDVRRRVDRMLDLVELGADRGKYPYQLSGGMRQRVAVARALAIRPLAMLFDEPFSGLDAITRGELRREVRALLQSARMPALFITHDQEEALELADRIAILNEGRIEQIGTPFDVYNRPRTEFVATFLGAANVLLGRWRSDEVTLGPLRLRPPADPPVLEDRQAVKVVFRPEDVVLNFEAPLLGTPHHLGHGVVEGVSYVGPAERLVVRLTFSPRRPTVSGRPAAADGSEVYVGGLPITVSRTKWEAGEMQLSPGDDVMVGLKDYRLLPHYPLRTEPGAKVVG